MDTSCTGCLETAWLGLGEKPGGGVWGVSLPHMALQGSQAGQVAKVRMVVTAASWNWHED